MASSVRIKWDDSALKRAASRSEGVQGILGTCVEQAVGKASAMSAGYRTGIWHDPKTRERRGDTRPSYGGDVSNRGKGYIGLVHPLNYAAMKDTYENNTLLKAVPHV